MKLFHNPRCSKSREALALLEGRGLQPEVIRYLESPLDVASLDALCVALDRPPQALVRFKDDAAKTLGLRPDDERSRAEWLGLLAEHPALIERPILLHGNRAVIGRPPETILSLL